MQIPIGHLETKVETKDYLVKTLEKFGVVYHDLRNVEGQGALHILDSNEARKVIQICMQERDVVFNYAQIGHKIAHYRPEWWTTYNSTVPPLFGYEVRTGEQKLEEELTLKVDRYQRDQRTIKSCINMHNFMEMSRTNLAYNEHENCMILYETHYGEKIGWRYPGLESSDEYVQRMYRKGRKGVKNLYDFKPDLFFARNGKSIKPLQNRDIAMTLEKYVENNLSVRRKLCALLIHIAYMNYHVGFNGNTDLMDVYFDDKYKDPIYSLKGTSEFHFYKLDFPDAVDMFIYNMEPLKFDTGGSLDIISVEALLYYIDILGNQEESKYHYKDLKAHTITNNDETARLDLQGYNDDERIYKSKGRINFILTLANIVQCAGVENLKWVLKKCYKAMDTGVTPLVERYYKKATGNLVEYEE